MAAITVETARGARASGDIVSGALLALRRCGLVCRHTLRRPLAAGARAARAAETSVRKLSRTRLSLGRKKLALAGGFAFLGDGLLLAACIVLASRSRRQASDLERSWMGV